METESATVAIALGQGVVEAFRSRDWGLLASSVLMLVVVLARQFRLIQRLPAEWVPWATGGLAIATAVALGIEQGQHWTTILSTGLVIGLTAIGMWETVGKSTVAAAHKVREHVTGDLPPPPAPPAPPTPPADGTAP